jgi:hypothetical protein
VWFTSAGDDAGPEPGQPPGHVGFVAGRYRNWTYSDMWTDVRRCADRTFTGFVPACTCGWVGAAAPADDAGWRCCQRAVRTEHLAPLRHRSADSPIG